MQFQHGTSLLGGWLPPTLQIVAAVVFVVAIGRRSWWMLGSALVGVVGAVAAKWYVDSEGLASDPAPMRLWIWVGVAAAAIAVFVFGWRGARWWRRGVALLAIPVCVACAAVVVNQWVGYYPTVQAAWNAVTAGPLPDQVDAADLPGLRNTSVTTGKVVAIDTGDDASGFKHRTEYVYLPPAWFAGAAPPQLPAVLMIAGEFNTPADWMRSGNITPIVDKYAADHGGTAPILVFADSGGSFNNDTECVNGPRGAAADHLTKDLRPYVISQFGASPSEWGVVGWSMGGTCAIDLTVMHPDLFTAFVDIAGDAGPTAGTKQQTIDHLFGGDATQWDAYDPATVLAKHGPYQGVSGLFEDLTPPARQGRPSGDWHPPKRAAASPSGFGGHDDVRDTGETGAAEKLCTAATAVNITCEVHTTWGGHTWQFAEQSFATALPWLDTALRARA